MKVHWAFFGICTGRNWQRDCMQFTRFTNEVTCKLCRKRLRLDHWITKKEGK